MADKNKTNNAVCAKTITFTDGNGKKQEAYLFELLAQPGETFFVSKTKYFEAQVGVEYRPVLNVRSMPYLKKGRNGAQDVAALKNVVHVNWELA